ncbi:MAG TPA: sodium transporter, partial [Phaeodactylibacter sp.]|nr:sodium transporter [Phaeodactylibacter sp.]
MNLQRPLITGIFWALLFTTACRQAPASHSVQREAPIFHWDSLPALIPFVGDTVQYGLGGVFAGTHHGVCILAGGTNFRGQPFWQGGTKHWYPHIMVFDPDEGTWQQQDITLPRRLSYGVAISTSEGMFLIGGRDARHISRKVYLLRYDEAQKQVLIDSLSDLPLPLCFMSGARVGDAIYLAGGMDSLGGTLQKHFYRLSLKGNLKQNRWEKLSPWQGAARLLPTVVAQSDGRRECLFLFGGQFPRKGQPNEYLSDAYRYNPDTGEWTQIADIQDAEGGKKPLFASLGAKVGSSHVALFGGVDGSINRQLEQLQLDLATAKDSFEIRRLKDRQKDLLTHHPGFYRKVLIYHSITDRWREGEEMPYPACITTTAFWMDNQLIIPSGEISPGRRSPRVYKIALAKQEGQMSVLDYSLLVLYALVLLGMGGYFAKRQHSTEDYFRGGGRIPWWAAALSLFGTGLSAITFMAVPAKTFATNWAYLVLSLSIVLVPPVVSKVFIPAYRKYNISSAFQYLRLRFNRWVQLIGAATFLLFQLGRVGIILYLPALALHVVLGVNLYWCIGLVGLVSLFYTFMGGIEAVIWTDVFQVIVLVGG